MTTPPLAGSVNIVDAVRLPACDVKVKNVQCQVILINFSGTVKLMNILLEEAKGHN